MHAWVLLLVASIVSFALAIFYKIASRKNKNNIKSEYEEQVWLGILLIGFALSFLTIQTALMYPDLFLGMKVR